MKRKHLWLPCGIIEEIKAMSEEDYHLLLRETDWQKWITDAMWKELVGKGNGNGYSYNRTRLRQRAAEWMTALARIRDFDEQLYFEAADEAAAMRSRFNRIQKNGLEGLKEEMPDFSILGDFHADMLLEYIAKKREVKT